jgi:hypothetical protein|tara:strand:+ start:9255 stop:9857 length:603 start_codon:yes stop_codon:yes gene_type:complete
MKIYEMLLGEDDLLGVNAVSLVNTPAIMSDWVALGDQKPILLAEVSKDKQVLLGAALIPDKPIFRKGENGAEDFYIYFSKETIAKTAQNFFKNNNQNNATLEHDVKLAGMTIFESWIVEDSKLDKSAKYGLNLPEGTWAISMKVDDQDVWDNYIKNDKVFGFSIEGQFSNALRRESDMNFSDEVLDKTLDMIRQIVKENI